MLKLIKQLFSLLSKKQVKQFYILQLLVIVMAFTELVGIASIAPFMALVGDMSLLESNRFYATLYRLSSISEPNDFLFFAGMMVLSALALSAFISIITTWRLALYGAQLGMDISDRLYSYYMRQSWQFHASSSSAQLIKQVSTEAGRINNNIIQPLMRMNAKIILALFISLGVIVINPSIALVGLLLFSLAYVVIYKLVRQTLIANGKKLSSVSTQRFRLMNEGFGGIKDVLILNQSSYFINQFKRQGDIQARAMGLNVTISQVPRFFIELLAFGVMIGLVLILLRMYHGNLGEVLPLLAVYALACFKLLPAIQQIYVSFTEIKSNIAAFEALEEDLIQSKSQLKNIYTSQFQELNFRNVIELSSISFKYPNKLQYAINDVSMTIPINSVIGIVGSSGSGKSTLIDIILGLLTSQSGYLYVDDVLITEENKHEWQAMLGFVPQSIFLSEGTIAENIAFGIPNDRIDIVQVQKSIKLSHLSELIAELPEGIHTKVGERGVQLSGGQRQRIAIARALYNEADILVFDEATSALDGITEKIIMDAIHDFSGKKTIIMIAHRLKTVQKCDTIYLMEKGKIIDYGTYQYLVDNNLKFKEMAAHS